jgi:hypothetical protein
MGQCDVFCGLWPARHSHSDTGAALAGAGNHRGFNHLRESAAAGAALQLKIQSDATVYTAARR